MLYTKKFNHLASPIESQIHKKEKVIGVDDVELSESKSLDSCESRTINNYTIGEENAYIQDDNSINNNSNYAAFASIKG